MNFLLLFVKLFTGVHFVTTERLSNLMARQIRQITAFMCKFPF